MTIYIDTGGGYPSGADIAAAGVAGVIGYVGTPGRRKNLTAGVVADYRAHGVAVLAVYEDVANDVATGRSGGVAHAQAALADMRNLGLPDTTPALAAADEHLTASMIPTATAYQGGFYDTCKSASWAGPVGGYGFSEFLAAILAAGKAGWTWQAGVHPAAGSGVNLWQRNGSDGQPTQMTIGGITVDIDDLLVSIPGGNMTDPLTTEFPRQGTKEDGSPQTGQTSLQAVVQWFDSNICDLARKVDAIGAPVAALTAAVAHLTQANGANQPVTAAELQAMVDQAVAQHIQVTGTVQIGSVPPAPAAPAPVAAAPAPATPVVAEPTNPAPTASAPAAGGVA